MHLLHLLPLALLASAAPTKPDPKPPKDTSRIKCPIIFDGRVSKNLTLQSFNSATTSPFNPDYVKGENISWSDILLLPGNLAPSRFDEPNKHRAIEVTIDDRSLFRAGPNLQTGFRRAGLLFKDDANDPGADGADKGVVSFHWSVKQDARRGLNLSHEYMNVWHERADYAGNQFMFVGGVVLPGDGGTGIDTKKERQKWRVQNFKNEFIFETAIDFDDWQNFAVQLDYTKSTIRVFYSLGNAPLRPVTRALPNDNSGGGQLQLGIAKKPTETKTVVFDGYQEKIRIRGEGQVYGGVFVEGGGEKECVSL
ncbi:hypothetical protein FB567DRAFT_61133 [Paraphoma chrysanthemicola]|uniref:Glycoside hydrolase 131 catalytic N-terminal domain-containing protein n=1 Tax=Paraphoma chrysanthemicola TaxID=798071 RepID=A0A8K0R563_9PLEO|nr:hypothetical protein FB567DRAFT_61133 [Paraphoma chrysanthemicola]